jgi:cysteinyl-tRNA synthetase
MIRLYNTLTKSIDPFAPLRDDGVRMYSCGPTVYDVAHIGNMRAFLFPDVLQRTLRVIGGYPVRWVMNVTDIDDKTIRDSSVGSARWRTEMGEQTSDPMENLRRFTSFFT